MLSLSNWWSLALRELVVQETFQQRGLLRQAEERGVKIGPPLPRQGVAEIKHKLCHAWTINQGLSQLSE